jgi:MFS family permease
VPQPRFVNEPPAASGFKRDAATVACYALLAVLTVHLAMIGPLMPSLMADLGIDFTTASFHSVALAIGMAVTGGVGERVPHHVGRDGAIRLGLASFSGGLILICLAPHLVVSLPGAFLVGCGSCLVLMAAPAMLVERHGAQVAHAFGEANVIAYLGILAAPAIVSLAILAGSWRLAFIAPAVICLFYVAAFRGVRFGSPTGPGTVRSKANLGFAYWCFWGLLFTSVSAENIIVIWSASYYEKQLGLERDAALWASMAYPLGMLLSRIAGIWLVRRFHAGQMTLPSLTIALLGALLFSWGGAPWLAMAGLFITALGMGCLYPFGITLAMASVSGNIDTATARISLASAFSMITAPFLVGALADRFDLAAAFLSVPVYLLCAIAVTALGLSRPKATASRS